MPKSHLAAGTKKNCRGSESKEPSPARLQNKEKQGLKHLPWTEQETRNQKHCAASSRASIVRADFSRRSGGFPTQPDCVFSAVRAVASPFLRGIPCTAKPKPYAPKRIYCIRKRSGTSSTLRENSPLGEYYSASPPILSQPSDSPYRTSFPIPPAEATGDSRGYCAP